MFIRHGDSNIFSNILYICRVVSYTIRERDVKSVNKFVLALSNKEMIKINIVDLEKLYNFVVKNFLI